MSKLILIHNMEVEGKKDLLKRSARLEEKE